MAHVSTISIHCAEEVEATAHSRDGTDWLTLEFRDDDGERVQRFRVSIFTDIERAVRVGRAITAAWPEPEEQADPVLTWPRPSYHTQARGEPASPHMRGEDVLPKARLDALNGDDGPEEAA